MAELSAIKELIVTPRLLIFSPFLLTAFIYYNATVSAAKYLPLVVELLDEEGNQILYDKGPLGRMSLPNPKLWWPYTMSNTSYAYLYTLQVRITLVRVLLENYYE